ncbi:MAG: acid phosphatase [Bacteroidota bacterium]|nr:acid phosphatase [Bacteroidota bacterium]
MKNLIAALFILISFFGFVSKPGAHATRSVHKLPAYDHIVVVMEENKSYAQVIGNAAAPYINSLRKEGANLTRMFSEEHASEGNYFWLFSGSNQNVGFNDVIPNPANNKNYPFLPSNLGEQLLAKGYSFKGYSESLPAIGDTIPYTGNYARKHVPWISFGNIPNGDSEKASANLQFVQFPSDYGKLPTVSFVIPNLVDDMHNPGSIAVSVKNGDAWLKKNLDRYYQWAKKHNSLLIITFDENDDHSGYRGLTDPASANRDIRNRIPTIIAGAHVAAGDYPEGKGVTHVNILRTIESMYSLLQSGKQQENALKFGIRDDDVISDIFK